MTVESVPFVNLAWQYSVMRREMIDALDVVGTSGIFILGDHVRRFEEAIARRTECSFAVAVGNGSDGLTLTLRALGIGPGDEVVTVPNSFIATASSSSLLWPSL